jgi:hypothetical protein
VCVGGGGEGIRGNQGQGGVVVMASLHATHCSAPPPTCWYMPQARNSGAASSTSIALRYLHVHVTGLCVCGASKGVP